MSDRPRLAALGRVRAWVDSLRTRLWPAPVAAAVVAVLLGVLLPEVDRRIQRTRHGSTTSYLFGGGADAARTLLSAIAGSLITVTSLTFSLTVVTLQLASSQYSPRLLRTFTRDGFVQATLALFLSTFTYSLTLLRVVRSSDGPAASEFVPRLSVTVAFLLTAASVLGLVLFLAHLTREIRAETVLAGVHAAAAAVVARVYPPLDPDGRAVPAPPPAPLTPPVHEIGAAASGFLTAVDRDVLLAAARDLSLVIHLDRRVGDFVVIGQPVGRVWRFGGDGTRPGAELPAAQLAAAFTIGQERTSVQDVAFGLRQITDVAVKALSPGVNDPTTAVHALNWSSVLLSDLAGRRCGPDVTVGEHHALVIARPGLAELSRIALEQPLLYGAGDPDVMTRIVAVLADLARRVADPDGRSTVRAHLAQVRDALPRGGLPDDAQRRLSSACDEVDAALIQGHR